MNRPPGPLCGWELGPDWIDAGTLALTRSVAPADHAAVARPARVHRQHSPGQSDALRRAAESRLLALATAQGMTDPTEQAMFLAQVSHESNGFTHLRESFAYTPHRLHEIFPHLFRNDAQASEALAHGADAVAESVYGAASRQGRRLGNVHPGDGGRYRGRGYIQLTGLANYTAAGRALNLDLVGHPELAEDPQHAAEIAVWFWMQNRNAARLRSLAALGDVAGVTHIINGGYNGLADRRRRFHGYQRQLGAQGGAATRPLP